MRTFVLLQAGRPPCRPVNSPTTLRNSKHCTTQTKVPTGPHRFQSTAEPHPVCGSTDSCEKVWSTLYDTSTQNCEIYCSKVPHYTRARPVSSPWMRQCTTIKVHYVTGFHHQLEALGQCIPPPRHIQPVSRSGSGSGSGSVAGSGSPRIRIATKI